MIEEIVLQHLAGQLEVPVGMEVPENPADTFCVLEKTGSGGATAWTRPPLRCRAAAPPA